MDKGWLDIYKPELFDTDSPYVQTNKNTKMWVTFLSEDGNFYNSLGFYSFDLNNPPKSAAEIQKKSIIFPNTNMKGSRGDLVPGDRVYIGEFPPNTGIGFFLYTDAWDPYKARIDLSRRRWSIYTNYTFNLGKYIQHFFMYDSEKNRMFLTYEDLYYDWDE